MRLEHIFPSGALNTFPPSFKNHCVGASFPKMEVVCFGSNRRFSTFLEAANSDSLLVE